jgi:hypothetical protein
MLTLAKSSAIFDTKLKIEERIAVGVCWGNKNLMQILIPDKVTLSHQ